MAWHQTDSSTASAQSGTARLSDLYVPFLYIAPFVPFYVKKKKNDNFMCF